jgi:hypothetical protein
LDLGELHTTGNNYVKKLFGLGYGWQLEMPFIETITSYTYDPSRGMNVRVSSKDVTFLNLGNGLSYEVKYTAAPNDSNLVGYDYKDLRLRNQSGTLTNPTVYISYSQILYNKNGQNTYFYNNRMVAIKDSVRQYH